MKHKTLSVIVVAALVVLAAPVAFAATFTVNGIGEITPSSGGSQTTWTNTAFTVTAGTSYNVTAQGLWSWGGAFTDAAGEPDHTQPNTWDRFLYVANHGELIGYIGLDPLQGNWGNYYYDWNGEGDPQNGENQKAGYMRIGTLSVTPGGFNFLAASSGTLWLGMNDDAVSFGVGDNDGSLQVTVNAVPEPSTMLLLGSGLLGLVGCGRRRLRK